MQRPTAEEMERAKVALFDYDEQPSLVVLDRSTVERAATCPWQAHAIDSGKVKAVGVLAESGEEVHKAFGEVLHSWIDSRGAMSPTDLRQDVDQAVRFARPDLQPEAIRAIQGAVWSWSQMVYAIHPSNILAFDGGEDIGRSGQLAIDIPDMGVRYTSELDLLYQGDCPDVLEEVDYKTGWKDWAPEDIRDSFQFQSHAVLALEKYPDRKALRVRVFETRSRRLTYGVIFPRERMHDWKMRIRSGIDAWRVSQQENPPTWPTVEKCSICPAAALCPVSDLPMRQLADDPAQFVRDLVAVEARAEAMRKLAAGWVDEHKQDIQAGDVFFGRNKPKSERKATATIYQLKE